MRPPADSGSFCDAVGGEELVWVWGVGGGEELNDTVEPMGAGVRERAGPKIVILYDRDHPESHKMTHYPRYQAGIGMALRTSVCVYMCMDVWFFCEYSGPVKQLILIHLQRKGSIIMLPLKQNLPLPDPFSHLKPGGGPAELNSEGVR